MPRVSVITPCYNGAAFLRATIESVRAQTLNSWEHVVVDDGSTDGSAAIVAAQSNVDRRLRLVQQPNQGLNPARTRGFAAAAPASEYLIFLDADDCLEPAMLEQMVGYLDAHPRAGLAYCAPIFIDAAGAVLAGADAQFGWAQRYVPHGIGVRVLPDAEAVTPFVSVYCLAPIVGSVSVIRRTAFERAGGFDDEFGMHHEDTDCWLRIALNDEVHRVDARLVRHRRHASQSTADPSKFAAQERKLYAKWRALPNLSESQRATVDAAERFRQGRLIPYAGMKAAWRHLARGEVPSAVRFGAGALRRYVSGFLPALPAIPTHARAAVGSR